ncbi:ABC transporter ATP-binding protein [soil metagenome]
MTTSTSTTDPAVADALDISSLSGGYGRFNVVHDIALRVERGEAVALLGPNGAGKTTILRAIMGLLKHRSGSISVQGVDLTSMPVHKIANGHVGLVPEGRRLFLNQSVEDNLRLGGLRFRRDPQRSAELLQSVFDLFPVVERYRHRPATALSGGEQQMVAIGRMMMSDPALMLLDEPSLGLAPLAIVDLAAALQKLRDENRSILLVEQRVDLALQVCDRVYVLSGGRIVDEGRADAMGSEGRALIDAYLG